MAYTTIAAFAPPQPPRAAATAEPKFLLELIVADLERTSLHVARLALSATEDSHSSLRPLRHLIYADAGVMRLALRYADHIGLDADAAHKLDRLYADLSAGMKDLATFVDPPALSSAQREHLSKLLPGLRKLAEAASDALATLEPAMRAHLDAMYVHDSVVIRQYLSRACRGELTEAERRGGLEPPSLQQRRQSPRATINKPCRLAYADGGAEAMLIDVSRNGLGLALAGQPSVAVGQGVKVVVGERVIEGEVARIHGQQVGLRLKRPISITDPLYRAA